MPGERRSAIRDVTTLDIDSRSSATEYWRHRLLSLTHLRSGLVRRARMWPRVVSGGRGLVGEAHTKAKSRVSHRPLRQGRHAGRCGAAGARTVRARAVVACASIHGCPPRRLRLFSGRLRWRSDLFGLRSSLLPASASTLVRDELAVVDCVEPPFAGDAFEFVVSAVVELEA